ncbi:MAG: thiolase [Ponticaulis sp.]|nr:thiolase [Ponticaulis sp.]|tara:strand:- start:13158 stop:14303 length:1146 start_codon:yes stop_codon:yes gene_type:complete
MTVRLSDLRPVYVIGVGFHKYQFASETPYVELGLKAVRDALTDADIEWPSVQSAYVAKALLPMAPGRAMLRHLGATGLPIVHVENASASGSSAFRHACMEVAAGLTDVSLAMGVDKRMPVMRGEALAGLPDLANDAIVPFTHFALLADQYAARHGIDVEETALVAVKNHHNGSMNLNAQHQKERTLDQILGGKRIAGSFTSLQCTPVGEGAAAVIIASEEGIRNLEVDRGRCIRVTSSAARSQAIYENASTYDADLTRETTEDALQEAGLRPSDLDLVELHDAFTIEELEYTEAMGLSPPGCALYDLKEGAFDIGGRVAVSASGGLISMGHPIGPTGIGQIGEITTQLRGEAGNRQHKGARRGLAHMVGVGAVCYVHTLEK